MSTDLAQSTASGLAPRTLAALAYAAWWVTGLAVLAVERAHPFVRFHAWQSVLGLGAIWALGLACYFAAFLVLLISAAGFTAMLWTAMAVWTVGLVAWGVCLYKAWVGEKWKLPVVGEMAAKYAARNAD